MSRRIAIVTTKQPGTNPRMRKNADALSAAGYDVLVLYAYGARWADETDAKVLNAANWNFKRVGGHPSEAPLAYLTSRIRRKFAAWMGQSMPTFNSFQGRYLRELKRFDPHLVIGHNPGSLPVLLRWSPSGPVLFDAEDDHPGEFDLIAPESERVTQLEEETLPSIHYMTAASPLIGKQYKDRFNHLKVTTIDNAFERKLQPEFRTIPNQPLKFVWFSQVVGLDRGIQEFLEALETLANLPIQLTIIGMAEESIRKELQEATQSPHHTLSFEPPVSEKKLLERLGQHHIGLALETGTTRNRQLCRTNKLFCYPLAGCVTLASNTRSQAHFMDEYPDAGVVFNSEEQLTRIIQDWTNQFEELNQRRQAAWQLGRDNLNWEIESEKLVSLVNNLIQDAP